MPMPIKKKTNLLEIFSGDKAGGERGRMTQLPGLSSLSKLGLWQMLTCKGKQVCT